MSLLNGVPTIIVVTNDVKLITMLQFSSIACSVCILVIVVTSKGVTPKKSKGIERKSHGAPLCFFCGNWAKTLSLTVVLKRVPFNGLIVVSWGNRY